MKKHWHFAMFICSAVVFSYSEEVLNVCYDTWDLLQEKGATMYPDASLSTEPVACYDMGLVGNVSIPSVAMPQGPFSIESKFYIRDYNESDPNISVIFSGFDCNYGGEYNSEGVDFRVGGGYNYALKIQDVYDNVSDWNPPDGSDKIARASVSKAIGAFVIGSDTHVDWHGAWKEIYTDRCIVTNKWIHMVATWDGTNMLLYLDGYNATDSWRTVGSELPSFILPVREVVLGVEQKASGKRHFNGKIGYVKMYNEALSACEVWKKYRNSLCSEKCVKFIRIESPRCGEVISRDTKVKFAIKDSLDNNLSPNSYSFTCHLP